MRRFLLSLLLLAGVAANAQNVRESLPALKPAENPDIPHTTITFSVPKPNSPLQLPSTIMDGAPSCSANGLAFFQFWVPPPIYNTKQVYSVSENGQVKQYRLSRISELQNIEIRSFDPGLSEAVMLLHARPASAPAARDELSAGGYYLATFDYGGKLKSYSKLDLGFQPGQVAQMSDDTFLIIGIDTLNVRPIVAVVDSSGRLLQHLDTDAVIPAAPALTRMTQGVAFAGMRPEDLPPAMRLSATLSLFHFTHYGNELLLLERGHPSQIIEFTSSGQARMVSLKLPAGQIADSILPSPHRWLIRTYREGKDSQSNLYEVDQDTGATVREIRTSGVPATSIACSNADGYFGFRWVNQKPYIIAAPK